MILSKSAIENLRSFLDELSANIEKNSLSIYVFDMPSPSLEYAGCGFPCVVCANTEYEAWCLYKKTTGYSEMSILKNIISVNDLKNSIIILE